MSKLGWAAGGLVLGVVIGVISGRPREEARVSPPASETPTPVASPGAKDEASGRRIEIPLPAPVPQGESPTQAIARQQQEIEQLRAALLRAQQTVEEERAVQKAERGEVLAPPSGLHQRFSQQALFDATQQALKQAGFEHAQVTSVDCTEYPCIVYGDGMGNREDFDKLSKAEALAAYANDAHQGMGWGSSTDGGTAYRFGMVVYPKDDEARRDALNKRIRYRAEQMMESVR